MQNEHANHASRAEVLAIPVEGLKVGRSRSSDLRLHHSSISREHASIIGDGNGLTVEDHDSRFGTFVNEVRVRSQQLRPGDRLRFGTVAVYRVESDGLRSEETPQGYALTMRELSISRPDRTSAFGAPEEKTLVAGLSVDVAADAFVGILGPSGAGKSTLLNCLGSYIPYTSGHLMFDGGCEVARHEDSYRTELGHVPQHEDLIGKLTVRENLEFTAQLRSGANQATIDEVLAQLGLERHSGTLTKALSGGQRKRLSVGFELLRRPRLLLLDEPTSGLDPATEAQLMERLRLIADRGTTVVCTTHLMEHIRLFDQVIVLGVSDGTGRLAYAGPPEWLLPHFECRSYADLYERLEKGRFEVQPIVAGDHCDSVGDVAGTQGEVRPISSQGTDSQVSPVNPPDAAASVPESGQSAGTPSLTDQVRTLATREVQALWRSHGFLTALVAQPVALGALTCLSQYRATAVPVLFFCVVIAIWLGLNNASRLLVGERRRYSRERIGGLNPRAYLAAKAGIYAGVGLLQVLLLLLVVRTVGAAMLTEALGDVLSVSVVRSVLVLHIAYCGGLAMGLMLSTLVSSTQNAVTLLPLLIMPQLMISVVATGFGEDNRTSDRPFQPLWATLRGEDDAPERHEPQDQTRPGQRRRMLANSVSGMSLFLVSRPATLALRPAALSSSDAPQWVWLIDLLHLVALVAAMSVATTCVFLRRERHWSRLVGIA
jgi:ABC-type multidrug transport system ATPase subunit